MMAEVIAQYCISIYISLTYIAVTQQINLVIWQILPKLKNSFPPIISFTYEAMAQRYAGLYQRIIVATYIK